MSYKLDVPSDIRNGLMFPNVTSIKLMQRSTGKVRIVERATLKKNLSKSMFESIFNDIDMCGEYMSDLYHAIAHSQTDPWGEDVT